MSRGSFIVFATLLIRLMRHLAFSTILLIHDDKLTLSAWISRIVENAKRRISLIKRVAKTMKLPRDTVERFYKGYVRGYLRFGMEIWSHAAAAHRVYSIDLAGQRMCAGLLHRTRNRQIDWESNMVPLQQVDWYSAIRMFYNCLRQRNKHMRRLTIDSMEESGSGSTVTRMKQIWINADLPFLDNYMLCIMTDDDWKVLEARIKSVKPDREVKYWVYRACFWDDKVLSRYRAGV